MSVMNKPQFWDWTVGHGTRSNTSQEFVVLCAAIEKIIRGEAATLIAGRADSTARIIAAHIAHELHFVPTEDAHRMAATALRS